MIIARSLLSILYIIELNRYAVGGATSDSNFWFCDYI